MDTIIVTGGYMVSELREGKYIVWAGYVVHDDGSEEYVGTHNKKREIENAILDTYRKGPLGF